MTPIKVFISYSHLDDALRQQLIKHLSMLHRGGVIQEWHDRNISAGDEWEKEIDQNLESAQLILLLISSDFLASRYCYDIEMQRAMEKHAAGEAIVVPILLRACDWMHSPFAKFQGLPTDARPITSWTNQDEAWTDVVMHLRRLCAELQNSAATLPSESSEAQGLIREYVELETRRNSTLRFPLLDRSGKPFAMPMEAIHMDIPLYLSHEHHPMQPRLFLVLDVETFNEVHRESFTSNLMVDRAVHAEFIIGDESSIKSIQDFLEPESRLVVVGDPGSGKSTLLSKLAYHYGRRYLHQGALANTSSDARYPDHNWIPIPLLCRDLLDFTPEDDLHALLAHQVRKLGFDPRKADVLATALLAKLHAGEAILLVDGLDEIPQEALRQDFADLLGRKTRLLKTPVIVTSRVVGFHAVKDSLSDSFDFVTVAPLRQAEKRAFLHDLSFWSREPDVFVNELTPLVCYSRKLAKLCENTLLLVLVVLMRISDGNVPRQKKDIYRRTIELMIERHHKLNSAAALNINEIWPYLEYLAVRMRGQGLQKWTEHEVLQAVDELRQLEPDEPELQRYPPAAWLDHVIHGTGILHVAGTIVDERGFERPVIQFFHQSFQEYFAAQAISHGRGTSRDADAVETIRGILQNVEVAERRIERLGSGQKTEPVAAGQWQEVIRHLLVELESADAAIKAILPAEGASPRNQRALTIFALQCLADEPNVSDETALLVFQQIPDHLNDLDGFNAEKNTVMDEAVHAVTRSAFGPMFRQSLLHSYIREQDDTRRIAIGRTLASSWGLMTFENMDFPQIQHTATRILVELEREVRSAYLPERINAVLKMVDVYYLLQTKNPSKKQSILPVEHLAQHLDVLFDALQAFQHEVFLESALWAMIWMMDAKNSNAAPHLVFTPAQRARLERILADESLHPQVRVDAATLLTLYPNEPNSFAQADWVMEWAKIADGAALHRDLPSPRALPFDHILAPMRSLLRSPISQSSRSRLCISMSRLGCFEDVMIEPLFQFFEDDLRSKDERDEALFALVQRGGPVVARRLAEHLKWEPDPSDKYDVSERAMLALVGLGDIPSLKEQLEHGVEMVPDGPSSLKAYAYALASNRDPAGQQVLQ